MLAEGVGVEPTRPFGPQVSNLLLYRSGNLPWCAVLESNQGCLSKWFTATLYSMYLRRLAGSKGFEPSLNGLEPFVLPITLQSN